jgi:hypothetical protein
LFQDVCCEISRAKVEVLNPDLLIIGVAH